MKNIIDLFNHPELIPDNVMKELNKVGDSTTYTDIEACLQRIKPLGYTFEYYLDGVAYDLKKIEP